jgi:hypothetical protein
VIIQRRLFHLIQPLQRRGAPNILLRSRISTAHTADAGAWGGLRSQLLERLQMILVTIAISTMAYTGLHRGELREWEITDRRGLMAIFTMFLVVQASNSIPHIQQHRYAPLTPDPFAQRALMRCFVARNQSTGLFALGPTSLLLSPTPPFHLPGASQISLYSLRWVLVRGERESSLLRALFTSLSEGDWGVAAGR